MEDLLKQSLIQELALYTNQKKQSNLSFDSQLELADKIHNIKMKLNGVKPTDSIIDCIGCGS
jgi:AAA15 family ATPase/GTPase